MSESAQPFIIHQGRPAKSKYFVAAMAYPGDSPPVGNTVVCRNPKTAKETTAICHGHFTYEWIRIPDSFCQLNYGVNSFKLKTALEENFPEFRDKELVRFLLLEEI